MKKGIKWYLNVQAKLVKTNAEGKEVASEPHFRSHCITTVNNNDINTNLNEAIEKISKALATYQREGSGWLLSHILHVDLYVAQYTPIKGSSYLPLPKKLKDKKAILNIQNNDNQCFKWCILAALHPIDRKDQPQRIQHYRPYEHELNFEGIEFPVTIDKIPKFEKQNGIAVNVFGFEDGTLFPVHITEQRFDTHVDLLLYSQGQQNHYCLIRKLNRLLSDQSKYKGTMFRCPYCLHGFVRKSLLEDHQTRCSKHGAQKIELPNDENMFLSFKEIQKQLKAPFVIYADFESLTTKIHSASQDPTISSTTKYQHHQACGFAYIVSSEKPEYCKPPVVYRGEDAVSKFLEMLQQEEQQINSILEHVAPMNLAPEEEEEFQTATHCYICNELLGADRVRDHCHLTGKFRGAAHNECNLNYKYTGRIPVILHNLKGYDSHLIMQEMGKIKKKPIKCIANNMEKYITFSVGNLHFLDSLQFMNASLEKLVSNLVKEGDAKFSILKKYTADASKVPLLLRKGVYPYDYMDSTTKFNESTLPPKEAFYSYLTDEHISDADYLHAQNVFNSFQMTNLGDYHDLYLLTDVLLLADVFENFRNICLNYYKLDPVHYYTSPGLAWAACLKMTGVELELFTDPDMYLFIEDGLRGGISMISNRYAKANNPYIQNYDPSLPNNYITYLDANNLYGWAMSQPLPTHDFAWLTDEEIEEFDVTEIPEDSEDGYILEVDLEYPQELHDSHSDYPLAPEEMKISTEMLSPYCKQLHDDLNLGNAPVSKLVPNLNHKSKYILHYRNLQLYLSLGMRLKNIHRVLVFAQSPWLQSYISFNTEKRKQATNDFEKDFFKLMNNSVFGKTMENLRKHVNVQLITSKTRLLKLTASPAFESFRIFDENLAAVNLKKTTLKLNRPIYVGFSILDLSKVLMYSFHYEYMLKKYGSKCTLLFTDTDSLCYNVKTDDIYADFQVDLDRFDTSEYPTSHPLYSSANKKVIGKMKDETHGIPIEEFIGLRPKMYSLKYSENGNVIEKKTAKGISKIVTKRDIRHEHYKNCLNDRKLTVNKMKQIRSENHQLYSIEINKISLSPYDDKRYILEDGITTLAHGHYLTK